MLLGGQPGPGERAALDRAIMAAYHHAGITADPRTWTRPAPQLPHLAAELREKIREAAEATRYEEAGAMRDLLTTVEEFDERQKMAAASDKWERVGDAVGLPVMVMMCAANPHLFKYFEDDMRDALRGVLIAAIPQLKKKREEEQKVVVALTELAAIDPALAASDDPIGDILASFFAPAVIDARVVEPVENG